MKKIMFFLIMITIFPAKSYSDFVGQVKCGTFLGYVEEDTFAGIMGQQNYINGLISGMNIVNYSEGKQQKKIPTMNTIKYALIKGCKDNPMGDTLDAFFKEIYNNLENAN